MNSRRLIVLSILLAFTMVTFSHPQKNTSLKKKANVRYAHKRKNTKHKRRKSTRTLNHRQQSARMHVKHQVRTRRRILPTKDMCGHRLTEAKLKELIRHNHPLLKIADIDLNVSNSKLMEKRGSFDSQISIDGLYRRFNSSSSVGIVQEAVESNLLLSKLFRNGIEIGIGGKLNDGDIKTPVSPTGDKGNYFLKLNLPLLRGLGINKPFTEEQKAFFQAKQAVNSLKQTEIQLVFSAITAYWEWIANSQDVAIEKGLYDLSRFRFNAMKSLLKSGGTSQFSVFESKREVLKRQGRLTKSQRAYQKSLLKFSWFIWNDSIIKLHRPTLCEIPKRFPQIRLNTKKQLAQAKLNALKMRPELKNLYLSRIIEKLNFHLAENYLLPKLDLKLRAGKQNGKNGIDGFSGYAGVDIYSPIERREAKGLMRQALNKIESLDLKSIAQIQKIFLEISDAQSAINMTYQEYQAVRSELICAKKIEHGERQKFKHGDSTLFLVNRRERGTAETAEKLNHIKQKYYTSLAYFKAAQGIL